MKKNTAVGWWVAGLIVLPIALFAANNFFFDDALDARVDALGQPVTPGVPEAQNGYPALIAMGAADGADAASHARAWLAETRAAARENRPVSEVQVVRAKRPDLCDAAQTSCLAAVTDKTDEVAAQLEAYREDLQRYENLLAYRAYEEILDYPLRLDSRIPSYGFMGSAQRAYLVRAALAVQAGKIDDALSAVEQDMAFQRVMLVGARTLIGKMVAAANYTRDLAFVADLLQTSNADLEPFAPRLTEMLKPIPPAALRMDAVFDTEFGLTKQSFTHLGTGRSPGFWGWTQRLAESGTRFFYKPNATINKAYAGHLQQVALARNSPAVLARMEQSPAPAPEALHFWDYLDNPIGKIMLQIAAPSFASYALRLHDLDAYNRLMGLGAEIIAADVGAEGVANFVAQSDARFYDPYTGRPMAWDAASKQLSFKASDALARRKLFNMENGRVILRM
jgi:hypothetical protein